jgi:hypothetical protein
LQIDETTANDFGIGGINQQHLRLHSAVVHRQIGHQTPPLVRLLFGDCLFNGFCNIKTYQFDEHLAHLPFHHRQQHIPVGGG